MHQTAPTSERVARLKMRPIKNPFWILGLVSFALVMTFVLGFAALILLNASAQERRELDVVLPPESEARPLVAAPETVIVNVDKDGGYSVSDQQLGVDEVEQLLRRAVSNNPLNHSVAIRADKRVPFDHVVTMMNLCNKVGIMDYKVTTAEEE